jgi:hypothetical protein
MGIDYSASVSYGFIIPDSLDLDAEQIDALLAKDEFNQIDCFTCGDFLSGEDSIVIFVCGPVANSGWDRSFRPQYIGFNPSIPDTAIAQLKQFRTELGLDAKGVEIGWIFEQTLS